eukprot:1876492-Pleurochrysis_carterae.AAC.1
MDLHHLKDVGATRGSKHGHADAGCQSQRSSAAGGGRGRDRRGGGVLFHGNRLQGCDLASRRLSVRPNL